MHKKKKISAISWLDNEQGDCFFRIHSAQKLSADLMIDIVAFVMHYIYTHTIPFLSEAWIVATCFNVLDSSLFL